MSDHECQTPKAAAQFDTARAKPETVVSVQDQLIADIEERKRLGVATYGTLLYPGNGRDALKDAYEEAIDLALYLKQAILEREEARARRTADGEST